MNEEVSKEAKVILDGVEVSLGQLNEARSRKDARVVEESPGVYKTLKRLQG